ncbi:aminotransferase class I/II-fold pyridoxal phosphate-dependent enzyme [Virgibacillus sp. MSP4-1]|uniref:LL-diaminopimelate aminotransferase n=1 Tax=Virgibacillus sp. MSP4-1 TaxID=2700081 RepID=UPI0003A005C3|nr:LL-diaminopimelate aminotransferase [Virgibacillus sp. MSP4-1]QHS23622.1 aminotransferase class I/II-fold pyridoxal phosphate-dependent enzyme [Virgibacillus sp. MSP4-1]
MDFVSEKIKALPPYLFSRIQQRKKKLEKEGKDIIDLGIGAPDLPTPSFIIDTLVNEVQKSENHRYSSYTGTDEFREAVAHFYQKQYGVRLDPEEEVLALVGSKEGIAHFIPSVMNQGEKVLVPNPGYPVYRSAVHLAGGNAIDLPLNAEQSGEPDFERLTEETLQATKLMLLNYPGNPTAATVQKSTFLKAVTYAEKYQLMIAHDAAYSLTTFDGYQAPSMMQVPGAKEYAVEFGSLSKSFNMTGWRIGYAVGNREMIKALATYKSNVDTSQFIPIQKAAIAALTSDLSAVSEHNAIYQQRRDRMLSALTSIGVHASKPRGTFFIWAPVPQGYSSMEFADRLLTELGVIVTPGNAFGSAGEGYFRISLSVPDERLNDAVKRIEKLHTGGD